MASVRFKSSANYLIPQRHFYLFGEDGKRSIEESKILVAGRPRTTLQEITAKLLLVGFTKITTCFDACCDKAENLNDASVTIVDEQIVEANLDFLKGFDCVIYVDNNISKLKAVNEFCRQQNPQIKFINTGVLGAFCWCFCDFGDDHQVLDVDGEAVKEAFVSNIVKGNPTIVSFHEGVKFSNGETVTFSDVKGMTRLNGSSHEIQVIDGSNVLIGDTNGDEYADYKQGGVCRQIKLSVTVSHESFERQITNPAISTIDGKDLNVIRTAHLGILALDGFKNEKGHLPLANSQSDFTSFMEIAHAKKKDYEIQHEICGETLKKIFQTSSSHEFVALQNFAAAVVVQEAIKAVTQKYMPLNQWIFVDVFDLVPENSDGCVGTGQSSIFGEDLARKLQDSKIFIVGCGAVGCEILRNCAAIGIATQGMITVTDSGTVQPTNLNTHTLFEKSDLLKPKSIVAANAIKSRYKDVSITPHTIKVHQQLDETVCSDTFLQEQDVIICAVDNDKSARFIDRRCVQTCRPLIDIRADGLKGNLQVIIPHRTQSLTNENMLSVNSEQVPYCILKSFPVKQLHTIQWARDKFDNLFWCKPVQYQKFWESHGNVGSVMEKLEKQEFVDGTGFVAKFLKQKPENWKDCVTQARLKFEKYFNHKARQLLHNFPLDTRLENGHSFWQPPKQAPSPITFDPDNDLHIHFIVSMASLLAQIWGVQYQNLNNSQVETLKESLAAVQIPEFSPNSTKFIETDQLIKKPRMETTNAEPEDAVVLLHLLRSKLKLTEYPRLQPVAYDKDDATLHLVFVDATSKLRAQMYRIEPPTTDVVHQFAGKITPTIVTSATILASLAVFEMLRIINQCDKQLHRNCHFNSSKPCISFTEPEIAPQTFIKDNVSFTLWDTWTVHGDAEFTLQQLIDSIKREKDVEITTIVQASKIVYMSFMPGHFKRLSQPMLHLIDCPSASKYVELTIIIETQEGEVGGPAIRYYFGGPCST